LLFNADHPFQLSSHLHNNVWLQRAAYIPGRHFYKDKLTEFIIPEYDYHSHLGR
jgi:hypothetical protein